MYDRILVLIKGNNWDPWLNYVAFVQDPGTLSIYVCAWQDNGDVDKYDDLYFDVTSFTLYLIVIYLNLFMQMDKKIGRILVLS